jgi:hypothetical protein
MVNHKDEDKTNNNVDNLEWCDAKYNSNYGTRKDRIRDTKMKNGFWTGLSKKEYEKKYYQENKDKINEYRKDHKEHIKEYMKKWRENHKEYKHQYYLKKKAGL